MTWYKPALLRFKIPKFAELPSDVDHCEETELLLDCNGNPWYLKIYPGGESDDEEVDFLGVYLSTMGKRLGSTKIEFTFCVKDANGLVVAEQTHEDKFKDGYLYCDVLMKRSAILDPSKNIPPVLFVNRRTAHARKCYSFLSLSVDEGDGRVIISDMSPAVFKFILRFIYTGDLPINAEALEIASDTPDADDDMIAFGKQLIQSANEYELWELKMAVENVFVRESVIHKENVSDFILFADSQDCALLKGYAISYFLFRAQEVLASEESKCLREPSELLSEVIVQSTADEDHSKPVAFLRRRLQSLGLDIDGSKKVLMGRFESATEEKRQKKIAERVVNAVAPEAEEAQLAE